MMSYVSGQIKFENDDLGSKVKVNVTENVCKIMKKIAINSNIVIFKLRFHHSIGNVITIIMIPNMTILQNK